MQGWLLEQIDGVEILRCEALNEIPGVAHGFSTRNGCGPSGFDAGPTDDPAPRHLDARRRFLASAGIEGEPLILRQIHGGRVVFAGDPPSTPPEADAAVGVLSERPVTAAAVRTADCVPLLLCDRSGQAVAAVHAGWRGTAAGVAARAVEALGSCGIGAASS